MGLVEGESGYDRFKRLRMLAGHNRDHVESRIALARAAIGARDWLAARGALEVFVGANATERPSQRVCELMAEIEEGEHGNRGSAREWLARALHAPEDPAWTGEGWRSLAWSPINPVTGEFDALEWRAPGQRLLPVAQPAASAPAPADADMALPPRDEAPLAAEAEAGHELRPQLEEDEAEAFTPPLPDDPGPASSDDFGPEEYGGIADGDAKGERKW
jgi:HemY protein